jgi:hypothetical protein
VISYKGDKMKCIKCGQRLAGFDYLQGFEYQFCDQCVSSIYQEVYADDSLDDTIDPDEEDIEDDE